MLLIALELSNSKWKIGFTNGQKTRICNVAAGDLEGFQEQVEKARKKLAVPEDTPAYSIYEAGRDGFWIHRWLTELGIHNRVVDSASIQVNRRKRHLKTDLVDVKALLRLLRHLLDGDREVCSVVRVPNEAVEDERRGEREISRLKKEIVQHMNRIRSLLILYNIRFKLWSKLEQDLDSMRDWKGRPLPPHVLAEIRRELKRMAFAQEQVKELEKERLERIRRPRTHIEKTASRLVQLCGIGPVSAMVLAQEFFGWRQFKNVREVGACAGLTGTAYRSGEIDIEQGISKAGNRRVRALMIELAWSWVRYQGTAALSRWFSQRWGVGGKRSRRVGIVALARKLLVALWKFLQWGEVPEGARIRLTAI